MSCKCKRLGKAVGKCEVRTPLLRGQIVYIKDYPEHIAAQVVRSEWIRKRTGEHMVDCRRLWGRPIGGSKRRDRIVVPHPPVFAKDLK